MFPNLPPLDCLIAFEALSRHKSFTRAAKELQISQSALSRRVANLEEFIGRNLVTRTSHTTHFSVAGQRYAEKIQKILTGLTEATSDLMKSRHPMALTIACASGTSSLWLAPRLSDFIKKYPDIKLRVIVHEKVSALSLSEFDIGIYYLRSHPPEGMSSLPLIKEKVYAVCSPTYLNGRKITSAEIAKEILLDPEDPQRSWMTWSNWLSLCGVEDAKLDRIITANRYILLVQLAIQGRGILLGWDGMIDPLLDAGLLVRASDASATYDGAYSLVWPADVPESIPVRCFKEWAISQTEQRLSSLEAEPLFFTSL